MTRQPYQDRPSDPLRPAGQESGAVADAWPSSPGGTPVSGQQAWNSADQQRSTYGEGQSAEGLKDKAGAMTDQAQEKAGAMAGQAQEKVSDVASQAQEKADLGLQKTADGLERAAETLRSKTEGQDGAVGVAVTSAAGALEQSAGYLRSTDTEQLLDDLEAMVRQRPVESLLVAAGVGFVVSKALR
jgi:ElaB/YqjD/DUF883 family membrane-anchored ribosome-binding protein